jgi:hypothetical protein
LPVLRKIKALREPANYPALRVRLSCRRRFLFRVVHVVSSLAFFEWVGCALGILGAVLVAVKSPHAHWAWVLWLVSNLSWTAYGLGTGQTSIALQQGAFSITSMIGLWHWVLQPRLKQQESEAQAAAHATA